MPDEEPRVEPAPGALYDSEKRVEDAIRAYDKECNPGDYNALLIGWVVVAEWIDADGEPNLSAFAREGMPHWRINGLLEAGPETMTYDEADDDY